MIKFQISSAFGHVGRWVLRLTSDAAEGRHNLIGPGLGNPGLAWPKADDTKINKCWPSATSVLEIQVWRGRRPKTKKKKHVGLRPHRSLDFEQLGVAWPKAEQKKKNKNKMWAFGHICRLISVSPVWRGRRPSKKKILKKCRPSATSDAWFWKTGSWRGRRPTRGK